MPYEDNDGITHPAFIEKEGKYFNYIRGVESEVDVSAFNFQGIGKPTIIEQL